MWSPWKHEAVQWQWTHGEEEHKKHPKSWKSLYIPSRKIFNSLSGSRWKLKGQIYKIIIIIILRIPRLSPLGLRREGNLMTESSLLTWQCSFLLVFICQAAVPTFPLLIWEGLAQRICEGWLTTGSLCCTICCNYFNSNTFPYRTDIINAVFYNK